MITMHPGEYLKEIYIDELGMTQAEVAKLTGVDNSTISRLIRGDIDMSATMAVKLEMALDRSAESWMEMQLQHNLKLARKALKNAVV